MSDLINIIILPLNALMNIDIYKYVLGAGLVIAIIIYLLTFLFKGGSIE